MRAIMGWALAALAMLCAAAGPAFEQDGKWLRTETQHFIFYSDGSASELRQAARSLESFDSVLRNLLRPEPAEYESKLEVYLFRDSRLLRAVSPGIIDGARGLYRTAP